MHFGRSQGCDGSVLALRWPLGNKKNDSGSICMGLQDNNSNRLTYLAVLNKKGSKFPLETTLRRLSEFYRQDIQSIKVSHTKTTLLISFEPAIRLLDQTLSLQTNDVHCASAYPILLSISRSQTANGGQYLRELADGIRDDIPRLFSTAPPLSFACHDIPLDTIHVVNDYLGFGRGYLYDGRDVALVSSSVLALALAMPETPKEDQDFWKQYCTWGFAVDDKTYIQSVSALKPGTRVTMSNGKMLVEQTHGLGRLVQKYRQGELDLPSAIEVCQEYFGRASSFYDEPPIIGLSGGRDSRLIAALAVSTNTKCKFETRVPPHLEQEIAEQLVSASPMPLDWSALPFVYADKPAPMNNLLERAAYWFKYTDGDCWHSHLRRDIPESRGHQKQHIALPNGDNAGSTATKQPRVSITGGAGEIARSHFYDSVHILDPEDRLSRYLKYIRAQNKLIPSFAKECTAQAMETVFNEGRAYGIGGLHLLDYFFHRSRIKRAYPVAPGIFTPILNLSVSLESFEMAPQDKIDAKLIVDMTAQLVPEWANIPYFHQLASTRPMHEVNKTAVLPYYWETIGKDAYSQIMRTALLKTGILEFQNSDVSTTLDEEDRTRWPQIHSTFERVLWHYGSTESIADVQRLREKWSDGFGSEGLFKQLRGIFFGTR